MDQVHSAMHSVKEAVTGATMQGTTDKVKQLDSWRAEFAQTPMDISVSEGAVGSQRSDRLTTNTGVTVNTTDDSLHGGVRGPLLMEDFHFREKMTHFDHESIPERIVHARGTGVHGFFRVYEPLPELTKARFLNDPSLRTPVFVRFSTVLGSRGSPDTVRDVRGFATRFYTPEGNFDLVGNNIPVFFIQDAIKFPDIIHAGKPEPHNEIPQGATAHDNFWDFISFTPEATHMIMWILSDRTLPRSYRMMQGFGVHTFTMVNERGTRRFVKFHWKPLLGTHSLAWDECVKINGADPDFHRRDLWEAIEAGNFPEFEFGLQIVDEADENKFDFDILDATKIIPEELVPIRWVGRMTLNRNPDEFFAETEQVAFCTQNVVPGIGFSNDPLLQGRLFSYLDTQITRLGGPNFNQIPINRPMCPVMNFQRGGLHNERIHKGRINYFPSRINPVHPVAEQKGGYGHYPEMLPRDAMKIQARGPKFQEHFNQATLFWNSLTIPEREHLIAAAQFELSKVDDLGVRQRMIKTFNQVDFELAKRIAIGVGVEPPTAPARPNHGQKSAPVSIEFYSVKNSVATRKIAFLVADGFDAAQLAAVRASIKAAGALTLIVGPRKGPIQSKQSSGDSRPSAPSESKAQDAQSSLLSVNADFTLQNCRSVLFDAVFVVGGADSIATLARMGAAKAFINEAFAHCKAIGALGEGVDFLRMCHLPHARLAPQPGAGAEAKDDDVISDQGLVTGYGFVPSRYASLGSALGNMLGRVTGNTQAGAEGHLAGVAAGAASQIPAVVTQFLQAVSMHRCWTRQGVDEVAV